MDAPTMRGTRIGEFRELCSLCVDFNRPLFLEEILGFICSANKEELAKLRKDIADRTKNLKAHRGKRGRPGRHSDVEQRTRNRIVAWQYHVQNWRWAKIAKANGLEPTRGNIRTLVRWRDAFAEEVWNALNDVPRNWPTLTTERIREVLKNRTVRNWLRNKTKLPIREFPQECEKIILALAPIGQKVSREEFGRRFSLLLKKDT